MGINGFENENLKFTFLISYQFSVKSLHALTSSTLALVKTRRSSANIKCIIYYRWPLSIDFNPPNLVCRLALMEHS